jgi:hypothetical protein
LLVTPTEYNEDVMACISCDELSMGSKITKTYCSSLMLQSKSEPCFFKRRQLSNTETKNLHNKLIWACKKSGIEPHSMNSVKTWILPTRNISLDEIMK